MPGRNDYGMLPAKALTDPRVLRAAELYVQHRIAREATAVLAVGATMGYLGLWASRESDNGIVPGDGVAAVRAATLCSPSTARQITRILREPDVDLLTVTIDGLRVRGF